MSIISNWYAVPGRIHAIFQYLSGKRERGVEKKTAKALFMPPLKGTDPEQGQGESGLMFDQVLLEAKRLGLIEEQDDRISIPIEVAERMHAGETNSWDFFITWMEEILLGDSRAEQCGQRSVPFAFSWFFLQDPTNAPFFKDGQKERVLGQLPGAEEAFELNIAADFQNFAYWARTLGCCTWLQARGQVQIVPDTSAVIMRLLPEIFHNSDMMPVSRFLEEIGMMRPALEGGQVFNRVLNWASEEVRPVGTSLSKCTGFALLRLTQRKKLELQHLSDAETATVSINGVDRKISHIRILKG